MATRRSVWSRDDVRELLESFVPVADEVGRLQRGDDAECLFFRGFAEEGHYGGRVRPSDTRQGIYAVAPSGHFLASINTRRARDVKRMLETALERWRALTRAERFGDSFQPLKTRRWETHAPRDGLVLRVISRDLPRPAAKEPPRRRRWDAWKDHAWNLDAAWFRKEEARAWVPSRLEVGARHSVPKLLAERLARFHLVDNVRGQTSSFPAAAVERASIEAVITEVSSDVVEIKFEGGTRARTTGQWPTRGFSSSEPQERGLETKLRGRATWNRATERFTAFELVADGMRWGGTQFNARGDDLDRAPIGFVLELSSVEDLPVAPAQIWSYGWKR